MNSFLKRIAEAYVCHERENLADFCFIFPNKRSGTFFRDFLNGINPGDKPFFEPAIMTISDFVSFFSEYVEASRYDLLFTLYNEYARLTDEIDDFDRFVFWGDMLISDFNDVDRYLVDADMLFKNMTDYTEIATDFLSDEQKEIVRRYWGVDLTQGNPEQFWKHLNENGEPRTNRDSFVRLWEILAPLYRNYKKSLSERGLCFPGMQYKEVAKRLKSMSADDFPYKRIIIVGFNVLSTTEIKMFERLRDLGIGDFYWDFDMPEPFKTNRSASYFIKHNIKEFPSMYDISLQSLPLPEIEIVSVPSSTGQVKLTGKLLADMVADGTIAAPDNAIDTAIVLPSEELFINLLHSIPAELSSVNITMGYPLRLTSIAAMMRNIMSMHIRAKKVRDRWCFFYEDIKNVVAHPLLKAIDSDTCERLSATIDDNRLFTVPVDMLARDFSELAALFFPVDEMQSSGKVFDYVCGLIDFITESLGRIGNAAGSESTAMEIGFLSRYRQSVAQLREATRRYGIRMKERTFFHLIERTVNAESVNFIGEPLKGLQIMGVLETRALDFDNIILLSMNERIFPRKHYTRSFIPDVLRHSYGLSTTEFQECIYAYYFYRMIARARKITLMYDSRTSGLKGGEMSRYLYQLMYLYPTDRLTLRNAFYDVPSLTADREIVIKKTDEIMARVNRYLADSEEKIYLSPSAINKYLSCPLSFYLHYVEHVRVEDDINDYMDESTFGTIVHEVSELSYKRLKGGNRFLYVTPDVLHRLREEDIELQKLITGSINRHYNRLPSLDGEEQPYRNDTPLFGESRVIGDIIKEFIIKMFELEEELTPFEFIEGEHRFRTSIRLDEKRELNITGSIDRIDRKSDGTLRIVDYKTGSDDIMFRDFNDLFQPVSANSGSRKGILQLFLYCNALAVEKKYNGPIQPILYLFRKFATDGIKPVRMEEGRGRGKTVAEIADYREFNDKVMELLRERLGELFDRDVPFRPTPHPTHCKYCNFKSICGLAQ